MPLRSLSRLRRRPTAFWAIAAVLALLSSLTVARLTGQAVDARERWGTTTQIVVVTAGVAAGDTLSPGQVALRAFPAGLVPAGALRRLPGSAVAAVDLHAGEPLVEGRLARAGTSPVAARLPAGTRGIAVPADGGLPLRRGDVVDVLATFGADTGGPPTVTVARRSLVIHVGPEAVTLAVQPDEAARVAFAVVSGAVSLVLTA